MKRLHVHVRVADLDQSVGFYATLFGAQPTVRKDDYAKWMLDDPRVNFAISTIASRQGAEVGLDHLGVQAETEQELREIADRLKAADQTLLEQSDAACCYARSDKAWAIDPTGLRWETFHTTGEITTYGEDRAATAMSKALAGPTPAASACCGPKVAAQQAQARTQAGPSCSTNSCG